MHLRVEEASTRLMRGRVRHSSLSLRVSDSLQGATSDSRRIYEWLGCGFGNWGTVFCFGGFASVGGFGNERGGDGAGVGLLQESGVLAEQGGKDGQDG